MFSQITYPDNDVKFLYERSAKMSDTVFYQNNCPEPSNVSIWNLLYEEMYYAAHDTSWMQTVQEVLTYQNQFYSDTIVMGIMDYDFYYLKPEALSTGDYLVFNIAQNQFFDHPNPIGSPYGRSNIFAAAALKENSFFSDPVFRIDPNMFFTDNVNAPLYSNDQPVLRIDFGDYTGWHYFDMNQISHYTANYLSQGEHQIIVEVYDRTEEKTIKSSICDFFTSSGSTIRHPDELIVFPGMTVGAYYPCDSLNIEERKVIIYLEGFDLFDFIPSMANTIEMNYQKMIRSKYIEELQNFNYSFYVLDYDNSRLDLRINAMHTLNVIEYLKNKYAYSNEQFVFIGHSMGGVIGRFLLTYMESEDYQNGDYSEFSVEINDPQSAYYLNNLDRDYGIKFEDIAALNRNEELIGQMHNIRTFITLDSPHQGASIPLGLQQLYTKAIYLLPGATSIAQAFNFMLDGKAAKQLLIEHIDATPEAQSANSSIQYTSHPDRVAFMNQLAEMGNYPQYCKKIAYTSADMEGSNLRTSWNQNVFRWANDFMVNMELTLRARILWVTRDVAQINLRMKTNPNGSGEIFHASASVCINYPQIYWFGISINTTCVPILSTTDYAINTRPYTTSASGFYDIGLNFTPPGSTTPCTSQGNFGPGLLVGFSSSLLLCSNGASIGFVPLQSALDYGNGLNLPLNHNIQAENINTKLSRTPFDVIIGYTDEFNHSHSNEYYDPLIFNLTGQAADSCQNLEDFINDPDIAMNYQYAYYNANLIGECEVKRSLLCLEIGDEEMYLENWTLNRPAQFSAQYNMFVNERNPYYEYPSQVILDETYHGIYSKEAPFLINPNGYALFLYGTQDNPTADQGLGFVYNNEVSDNWDREDRFMTICVNNYAQGRNYAVQPSEELSEEQIHILLYPNPNNGEVMMLEYDFLDDSPVHIDVFDVSGKKVAGLTDLAGGENRIRLYLNNLENGMYLVRVYTATQSQTVRLIIN